MNFSALIDWSFFWSVFNNFLFSMSPFMLIVIAVMAVGMVLGAVIEAARKAKR
ncbi:MULTISPECIES: PTS ascorbate transporter subunit IIC [Brevibacillus]|uniref:PTS ascorbate transporter subunit IIC n=1 Tax=Brevibacillus TaxID=55080 RepID=UPI000CE55147|nr:MULTISPECIES: PTS ascorbate transporter subunit IIC [Brevibacillus]MBA4535488.1 PTS ascorbate transporter subunit IIC [Brevibacillus halotolerans]PPA80781.1 PTS ascorbate transporter subunit IIC [Brevibacillus laterosporus]